jgi:hypothetical protein
VERGTDGWRDGTSTDLLLGAVGEVSGVGVVGHGDGIECVDGLVLVLVVEACCCDV